MHKLPDWLIEQPDNEIDEQPVITKQQSLPLDKLSWQNFERLCLRIINEESKVEFCHFYGKEGQNQEGIDLFAQSDTLEKYDVYQCKRVKNYGPDKINNAVVKFIGGSFLDQTKTFYLCTSESLRSNTRMDAIIEQRKVLEKYDINLLPFDKEIIETKLKKLPDIVEDFFGEHWRKVFCLEPGLKKQEQEDSGYQSTDIIFDEETKFKYSIDEIELIIKEINLRKEMPQPYNVKFINEDNQLQELEQIRSSSEELDAIRRNKKVELEWKIQYLNRERKINKKIINTFLKLLDNNYLYTLQEQAIIFKNMLDHDFFQDGHPGAVKLKIHHEEKTELSFSIYLTTSEWYQFEADIREDISMGVRNHVEVSKIPREILIKRVLPKYIRYLSQNTKNEDEIKFFTRYWCVYQD